MLNKKYKHAPMTRVSRFSDMYMERRSTGGVGCSIALNLSSTDDDRITCSVGSCSATSARYYKFPFAVPVQDCGDHLSDAESVYRLEHEEGNNIFTSKEELRAEVHKLELHAYCRTIEALHVVGPLSWEQEVMLTNLRIFLNISDEEHLMEGQIRKLVDLALRVAKVGAIFLVLSSGAFCDVPLVILVLVAAAFLLFRQSGSLRTLFGVCGQILVAAWYPCHEVGQMGSLQDVADIQTDRSLLTENYIIKIGHHSACQGLIRCRQYK